MNHTPTPWHYTMSAVDLAEYAAVILGPEDDNGGCPVIADIPERSVCGTHEGNAEFIIKAANAYDKHRALIETLTAALVECEEYFDNRSDADCDQDGYVPNEEMQMLQPVRDALAAANKEGF